MREAGQVLVKRPRTPIRRRVQHLEQPRHPGAEIRAIGGRTFLDKLQEDVARLEDSGVVGEQAEDGPHEEALQVVTVVAGRLEGVVQAGDQFGRLDVDRVLIAKRAALHADDEPELLHVPGQVGEGEACLLAFVAVEQLERLEVAQQLVAGAVPFGQRVEVGAGLLASGGQVTASALLLDQQHARPEQVDEAGRVVEPLDALLVPGDGAALDAEDLEERIVEALGLALLVRGVGPLAGEVAGAGADLVPGKPHRRRPPTSATATASASSAPAAVSILAAAWVSIGRRVPRPDASLPSRTTPSGWSGQFWPQARVRPKTDRSEHHFPDVQRTGSTGG